MHVYINAAGENVTLQLHLTNCFYNTVIKMKGKLYTAPVSVSQENTQGAHRDPKAVRVGFAADKVALGQVFLRVLRFSPASALHQSLTLVFYSSTTDAI